MGLKIDAEIIIGIIVYILNVLFWLFLLIGAYIQTNKELEKYDKHL